MPLVLSCALYSLGCTCHVMISLMPDTSASFTVLVKVRHRRRQYTPAFGLQVVDLHPQDAKCGFWYFFPGARWIHEGAIGWPSTGTAWSHEYAGPYLPARASSRRSGNSPPLLDWISHGMANWIYSDLDPFLNQAEKKAGPESLKSCCTHVYPLAEDVSET